MRFSLPAITARLNRRRQRQGGALTTELMIAISILAFVLLPISYSLVEEIKLARIYYVRAVAMEIIDGEMEILVAGEWKAFTPGAHDYAIHEGAATNLPPGRFVLTCAAPTVRLEWLPEKKGKGGRVWREVRLP